jgi:hypothetical protein
MDFTFRVEVTDNSTPVLQDTTEFTVTVIPISPTGLQIGPGIGLGYKPLKWESVEGATGYILERRAWDSEWVQIADTSNTQFIDGAFPLASVEYRIRAYNAAGQVTPLSLPIREFFSEGYSVDYYSANLTLVPGGMLVEWAPYDPGVPWLNPTITEYIVERFVSSSQGWVQVLRAATGSIPFYEGKFSFLDQSAPPDTYPLYSISAVLGDYILPRSEVGFFPPPSVDLKVDLGHEAFNPPQILDIADSAEESVGYFLSLNNNFDEGNLDTDGNPLPDNEADASTDHRIILEDYHDLSDRQLLTVQVSDFGSMSVDFTMTLVFPSAIKVWGLRRDSTNHPLGFEEIVSGTPFIPDIQIFPSGWMFAVEGIQASQALRDVELKVILTPISNPAATQEDAIRFTVGNLRAELTAEIDADTAELFAYVPIAPYTTEYDGELVALNLRHNGTVIESQEASIEDGQVTAIFSTKRVAGDEYTIETVFRGQRGISDVVKLVAGAPDAIEAVASKISYTADGTDATTLTVTIRDQFGNLVEDGTPVSWTVGFGDGTFADGDTTTATETTNGQATITLRAPEVPGIQHVSISAGEAETSLDILAEAANFEINGVAGLDIATGQIGTVTVTNANVADGTPVFWTLSNGEIVGGTDGGRVYSGTVQNGNASIDISATGPWARYGQAIVTATIAGRLHYHIIDFQSSASFAVEIEHVVLSGDKQTNGIEQLNFETFNPTFDGEPLWGFDPPPGQEWPAPRNVEYFAETSVTIHGTPNETYYIIAGSQFLSFAAFEGLGNDNEIQLDGSGTGTFTIRSLGLLNPNQFLTLEFTVREGTPNPFVGAPERTDRLEVVDHGFWTRTWDGVKGFSGLGDPQTGTGIAAAIAGGHLIVGDVGSLLKNLWRSTPLSETDPNYVEAGFAGIGLLTEIFVGIGEAPDAAASAAKAVSAATRGSKFSKIIFVLVKRAQSNATEVADLGKFLLSVGRSKLGLQVAKEVFTSEDLVLAGMRAVDRLGDLGRDFIDILAKKASLSGIGIRAAQDVTTLISRLSDDAINFFKALPADQLDVVIEHLGFIVKAGKVDIAQLRQLLDNSQLFTAAYDRSMMLYDLSIIRDSERLSTLVNYLKNSTLAGPTQGRLYELQTAARLIENTPGSKVAWVSKYAKEVDPVTGKRLASTDIDFIIDDGTDLIYYQAKSSATAFQSVEEAQRWVQIVQRDAERNGITNQVIRYVTPNPAAVPLEIRNFLNGIGITIEPSPLLR